MERLKRLRELPYTKQKKIISLVFEEAKRMREKGKINYRELSRIVSAKTGITLHHNTIRGWLTREHTPLGWKKCKAARRPPDEDSQVVRGLEMTDLSYKVRHHTIELYLRTTKDFFAQRVRNFLSKYGWTTTKPILVDDRPEWETAAFLDYETWVHELEKPAEKLAYKEKMKLLSGAISGDGYITIGYMSQRRVKFMIGLCSTQKCKAEIFHRILESISIPHGYTRKENSAPKKGRMQHQQEKIGDNIIQTRAPYKYVITVAARTAVKYLLANLKLLQPFREVKRILALRFVEKDVLDRDLIKPVWDYLRVLEKYSTIRSQIRACELIPDERFDKKNLNKQRMLKQLRRKLYKYADAVRNLKPRATRIISGLKPSP